MYLLRIPIDEPVGRPRSGGPNNVKTRRQQAGYTPFVRCPETPNSEDRECSPSSISLQLSSSTWATWPACTAISWPCASGCPLQRGARGVKGKRQRRRDSRSFRRSTREEPENPVTIKEFWLHYVAGTVWRPPATIELPTSHIWTWAEKSDRRGCSQTAQAR